MADIDIHRTHALGLKAARAAAEKMADSLGRKFGLKGDWKGDTLHFERPGVTGSLAIGEDAVHLSMMLGFVLRAMKGSIERAVNDELDGLFESTAKKAPEAPKKKPAAATPKKAPASKRKAR